MVLPVSNRIYVSNNYVQLRLLSVSSRGIIRSRQVGARRAPVRCAADTTASVTSASTLFSASCSRHRVSWACCTLSSERSNREALYKAWLGLVPATNQM